MDPVVRPLLIGMNNPLSSDPDHALYPHPQGCTGHRLWQMINEVVPLSRREYLAVFERDNLVSGRAWCAAAGRAAAEGFLTRMQGRTTVLLGAQVPQCLGLPRPPWGSWAALPLFGFLTYDRVPSQSEESRYCVIPHPSGLNRYYNDPTDRAAIAKLLAELYLEGHRKLGLQHGQTEDASGSGSSDDARNA